MLDSVFMIHAFELKKLLRSHSRTIFIENRCLAFCCLKLLKLFIGEFSIQFIQSNLRHIDTAFAKRKAIWERYYERLNGIKGIRVVAPDADTEWNYAYMPVIFDGYKLNRDEVQALLAKDNIFARKYFYPIVNKAACYVEKYGNADTPISAHIADCVLTLPMYEDLELEDVDRICDVIVS